MERFAGDAAGLEGHERLRNVANDCWVQVVLHGRHHSRDQQCWPWQGAGDGYTHVLAAGSLALKPGALPQDQPNAIRVVVLDPNRCELRVHPLVYEPRARLDGQITQGDFVPDQAQRDGYAKSISLPPGFALPAETPVSRSSAPGVPALFSEYRSRMGALYTNWDLRGVGVTQAGGASEPFRAPLDEMYLPVRFSPEYDINKVDRGTRIEAAQLVGRTQPLVLTGPPGAGKTTWVRYTFRQLLKHPNAFPIVVELRWLARFWDQSDARGED